MSASRRPPVGGPGAPRVPAWQALLIGFAALASSAATAVEPAVVVSKDGDGVSQQINAWFAEGKAAGLDGVYYDNRDRKHSDLPITSYPQLQPITYSAEELERRADWGGQSQLLPGKIVVGNSSTASPANQAGSHQRMFYTHPRGLPFLYAQYRSNALYIYPEHRDHDPGTNGPDGYGDLYPANSPYLISSQGSSGSDRVFMHAFLKTIAAFPPATRERLVSNGLLMPTLQAIFRKTYKAAAEPDGYFTGKAHPSAFEGSLIDEAAMVALAQAMLPEAVPPLVALRVLDEPAPVCGRDYFEPSEFAAIGERLGDSPCAIARVVRGPAFRRTLHVTAADSGDLQNRPLTFRWVVLRGDPQRIEIQPGGEHGEEATISVAYHARRPIAPGSDLWSNRVDIGVFAETPGSLVSAPAFISFTTLPNEHRSYNDDGRLLEIFYAARSGELGMPAADSERWDALLTPFDASAGERFKLLSSALDEAQLGRLTALAAATKAQRSQIAAATDRLATITAAQQERVGATAKVRGVAEAAHKELNTDASQAALDAANAAHEAAGIDQRDGLGGAGELKAEIATLRAAIAAALRTADATEIVRGALEHLRGDPRFFAANEAAIRAIAKDSPQALADALGRLAALGINASDLPSPNDRYHLEQLNAEILGGVLFADFLKPPPAPNYADPRLTVPKAWRDVYHYDPAGKPSGWTRYQDGEQSEFTADGEMVRSRHTDGSPDEVVKLRYQFNAQAKRLETIAIPGGATE
jgi:hypothetical protein